MMRISVFELESKKDFLAESLCARKSFFVIMKFDYDRLVESDLRSKDFY
jgi:hypothetical protein